MKRSDMHDAIYEEILGSVKYHIKNDLTDLQKSMILSSAADILDLIEQKGMLPPEVKAFGDEPNQAIFENIWEPEDV